MSKLARRAAEVKPSPTISMNTRAAAISAAGRQIIPLSLGEPDFHTPNHIKAAGIAAIERNFTKYTASEGYAPLRQAIVDKLLRENGLEFKANQVVVGSSTKNVLLAAMLTVADPGDEVVIPAPFWVSYPDLAQLAGVTPVIAECDEAAGLKLTPEVLERAITPRTRALIFNSPNNPSGAVYSVDEIRALAETLKRHPDVWVMTDELYEHIVFDGAKAPSFAEAAPELADRVVQIGGFSKSYVMTGWRISFAAAPLPAIKAIGDLLSQLHGSPSTIAQAAAIEALNGDPSFIRQNQATFQARRDLLVERLNRIRGLKLPRPGGAFYAYINCAGWIGRTTAGGRLLDDDMAVVEALLEEPGLATVPGQVFGKSPYFRISYALNLGLLEKSMDLIEAFAAGLR